MDLKNLSKQVKNDEWIDLMAPVATDIVRLVTEEDIYNLLVDSTGLTNKPIKMNIWFDIYWSASWAEALRFGNVEPASMVLEIGAGIATNFIRAASSLLGSRGKYITVNLNKDITEDFKKRTRRLPIDINIIEGNALYIADDIEPEVASFVAFNHQINDIIQTIVYEMSGQNTEEGDWFGEMLPGMVKLIKEAKESGEMEKSVKPKFLEIIQSCTKVLKTGYMMGFNNALVPITLRSGYSIEELSTYIPLARSWISEGIDNLEEVKIPGFDTQWWLFFKKV
ncbi:MAG: hypothetical protein PVF83_11570 [Anaerolineales bacterium]